MLPHVDLGGVWLEYAEQGAGDPIVLVHGLLGDLRGWSQQMESLSQTHRVIAYSRRNHHPNSWSDYPSDYSLNTEKEDLVGLIRELGLGAVNLLGSSYGGAIAAVTARDNPEAVHALVLNEPALRGLVSSRPEFAHVGQRSAELAAEIREKIQEGKIETAARIWTNFLMGSEAFDRLSPQARTVLVQNTRPLAAELSDAPWPFSCEDAAKIRMPTLLVSGEKTTPLFQSVMKRLAECIPGSETVIVPGASHSPHRQNAQFFDRAVSSFFAKHRERDT